MLVRKFAVAAGNLGTRIVIIHKINPPAALFHREMGKATYEKN